MPIRLPPPVRLAITACAATIQLSAACVESPSGTAPNTAPVVAITSPAAAATYAAGDVISISAGALDAEEGALPASTLSWWAVLHHDTHVHPFVNSTAGATGQATIPRVGHLETNIFYRVYARAVDREGLADTAYVDVQPRLVTLNFATVPAGLQVVVDGQPRTTPVAIVSVVGVDHALAVTSPQSSGPSSYTFSAWSQGGAAAQTYQAPAAAATLTATFTLVGAANVPPTVAITAPTNGATVTTGVPVTITANAADSDGTVSSVQFLEGTTVIGTDLTAPYSVSWTPAGTGARNLTARATDNLGASTSSAVIGVTVQGAGGGDVTAPVASITSPSPGTLALTGSVNLTATASDDVGVTLVEFALDGEVIATDATAPYSATLAATSGHTTGAHTFSVRARDAAANWSPWSASTVTFGGNVNLPSGFTRTTYASGFADQYLTAAAFAPDGRLFVLEFGGAVRIVSNGTLLPTPFVTIAVQQAGERGLLGIAFDPNFAVNNFIYFYYTTSQGGAHNRISRYTASGNVAVTGSELILMDLPVLSAASNHNGGAMAFGPDGMLYVAVGDNANTALPQSLQSTFGKMLRINANGSIPSDNPFFAQTTGLNRAIWALGLRNPYTFAIQPGTGRMHINDVGQDAWEEINLGTPGANFGWPGTEGPTTNASYVTPLLAYAHFNSPTLYVGFSIVGGAFYNPATNLFGASYTGDYFFADYVNRWIYRMDSDNWNTAYAFARLDAGITNLVLGTDGALYVLVVGGRVDRISR